ncbi:hypothetical protein [Sphingomonas alpina]|uniref:Uncharacterized protein n=1 Tax=Sphingomonas alpina TaxID=653931 RepID=A0A7H0LHI9_9SPHN|nr:hypothetical protein [Sphingomonas alpina]QNQ09142.1 hypothetical protein H3Z74_21085 [Sphingomonas alpina]
MRILAVLIVSAALCGCTSEPQSGNGTAENGVSTMVENEAVMMSPTPSPAPSPSAAPSPQPVETASPFPEDAPAFNEQQLTTYPKARGLPGDVQRFVARYEDCEHFIGEPDYDAERRAELEKAVAEVCKGIDAEAVGLRRKYAADTAVTTALTGYEDLHQ